MSGIAAYVLVDCGGGDAAEVAKRVAKLEGVAQVHALFGPIEAIAFVEAPDLATLEKSVLKIHDVPGVKGTDTRIARIV
ncbi:MAG: Lrp/AsnC ligand binding domain-containing protein [bacterium]